MIKEVIGYVDPIGNGESNMGLTDEEIIRCRDCCKSREGGWKCIQFSEVTYLASDEDLRVSMYANVRPDGHCAWGIRRES